MRNTEKYLHLGLLVLRIGLGIMFILHGYPKITGGLDKWASLGELGMSKMGISFGWVYWGFLAAASEFFGGLFLLIGLAVRLSGFFLFFTMLIAAAFHLLSGDGIMGASHAIESGTIFLFLIFSGGGHYALDQIIYNRISHPILKNIFSSAIN